MQFLGLLAPGRFDEFGIHAPRKSFQTTKLDVDRRSHSRDAVRGRLNPDRSCASGSDSLHKRVTELLVEGVPGNVPVKLNGRVVHGATVRQRVFPHVGVREVPRAIPVVIRENHRFRVFRFGSFRRIRSAKSTKNCSCQSRYWRLTDRDRISFREAEFLSPGMLANSARLVSS